MDKGIQIHNIVGQIQELKRNASRTFIYLGQLLKTVRDEKLWAGQWESFDNPDKHNFISEMDLGGKSTANAMIIVYEKFVEQYGIDEKVLLEAQPWKLALVAPNVSSKDEAQYWAEQATHLSVSDLKKTIAEKKSGIAPESCDHDDSYTIRVCRTCLSRIKE